MFHHVHISPPFQAIAKTFEIHPTDPLGSVREREELSINEPGAIEILNSRCQMNEICVSFAASRCILINDIL